jgi:hypothetical protein
MTSRDDENHDTQLGVTIEDIGGDDIFLNDNNPFAMT